MNDLEESLTQLLGRQATDKDRQELYRVRDALGLKNNDALWLVIMALQHYKDLYEEFPESIAKAAQDTLQDFKVTADAVIKASAEAAKADLAQAVATAAADVARTVAGTKQLQWMTLSLLVALLSLGLFGWHMYQSGYEVGYSAGHAAGYEEAKSEKAAASWANTPEGQLAYRFAQLGELSHLARCDRQGWEIKDGLCAVHPLPNGGVYGWRVP